MNGIVKQLILSMALAMVGVPMQATTCILARADKAEMNRWVDSVMTTMSERDKVAQLMVVTFLPDDTPEQQKLRRKAMKKANKAQNIYAKVAMPYLSALRTVKLAEGYENLNEITADYEEAKRSVAEKRSAEEAELKRLAEERKLDIERKRAQRKMKK